jgi:hypothetical protein
MNNTIFKLFDPMVSDRVEIPSTTGIYIIVLREGAYLPTDVIKPYPQYTNFKLDEKEYEVVYVGKSKDLQVRDYAQHFNGKAGSSTLRKSIGCLMGFTLIPRDKNIQSRKTTLRQDDEVKVSNWMKKNLLFFYYTTDNPEKIEKTFIAKFNPPLNLKDNHNLVNMDYRRQLSNIRKTHIDRTL